MSYQLFDGPSSFDPLWVQEKWLKKLQAMQPNPQVAHEIERVQFGIAGERIRESERQRAEAASQ